ncbi:GNAT family N-acetyltransferase [Vibrio sp. 99-70-13A1]|uniref:GNAT family N-acetyltransferase n=1 Tax=Vibrio sp. 99-70-13A1 TaxID=2607601 RepID=UPI0014938FD8|nr:GNAT family N-acetyltransferase [Vibrio sp. 99-70-13A1]NOH97007.1 GNAT family N-acetyltransferase [Vibrio sp. 99-70-13A1]
MTESDLIETASVHQAAFSRQRMSYEWLLCNLNAFPRFLSYVIEIESNIVGYIVWSQKSGFRTEAVLELEQLAVLPNQQGKGYGRKLIEKSFLLVEEQLQSVGSVIKHALVSTRADNKAQQLYANVLGAEVEVTISNLYSADEVLMIARNVSTKINREVTDEEATK